MSGTSCLTKKLPDSRRGNRKSRRKDWYVQRMTLNAVIIKMVLAHYQAVRMSRIRDPHWRPLITTDNFVPGAALDLEDQDQGGEMDR